MQSKTLKFRVKDRHAAELRRMAHGVNIIWNYINDLSFRNIRDHGRFLSAFAIHPYTTGCATELGLHSQTLQMVAAEYVNRRKQFKKRKLNWRKSRGVRKSLGWVPFNTGSLKFKDGFAVHRGIKFRIWDSYGLDKYELRSGSFNEDARGRWYLNVVVKVDPEQSTGTSSVGIDLGCKEAATTSDGEVLVGRWYRKLEGKLKQSQRAKKRKQTQNLHAKAANRRKDALHKLSRKLVDENAAIFVGNISSKAMSKTHMAKSALDAGWGMFKMMLTYKCDHAGVIFEVVNEAWTSQTCSCCGSHPDSRPKGITGLGIREWTCCDCGAVHDRDVNAAKNILAVGHGRLAEGIVDQLGRHGCHETTAFDQFRHRTTFNSYAPASFLPVSTASLPNWKPNNGAIILTRASTVTGAPSSTASRCRTAAGAIIMASTIKIMQTRK